MSDLHLSPYTGRIIEVTGADHREALILEAALRWGFGNSGTLDHLDAREFDKQVREVVYVFAAHPSEREESEKLAEVEHLIPAAPKSAGAPKAGDRVRVWFTGNGVVVEATDDPKMKPYTIRLDGADADSYYHANQVCREVVDERRPVRPGPGGGVPLNPKAIEPKIREARQRKPGRPGTSADAEALNWALSLIASEGRG